MSVLCKIEPEFEESYSVVASTFPDVTFIREVKFSDQVPDSTPAISLSLPSSLIS